MKIAIVQQSPVYFNLEASLKLAKTLVEQAAKAKAQLIVFGESWLSGYPVWLDYCPEVAKWNHPTTKAAFTEMYKSSISIPGPEIDSLQELAVEHKLAIVLGCNEKKSTGTLYNSFVIINEKGELANHHRKLMPTYTEKMLYGLGDAEGLKTVEIHGYRLGGLICWEHWMPLARQRMHDAVEHVHIALWPWVHEMHQVASRQYAFEGRCFVIAVGQLMQAKEMPLSLKRPEDLDKEDFVLKGQTAAIGPNGQYLLAPQKEGALHFVELPPLEKLIAERMTLDVSGHYQRPDIFELKVNQTRHKSH